MPQDIELSMQTVPGAHVARQIGVKLGAYSTVSFILT